MNRDRLVCGTALLLACAGFGAAAQWMPRIERQREDLKLDPRQWGAGGAGMPAGAPLEFNAALGIFRGVAIDYLWMRSMRLKEEGKYYEAMELSELITSLQPRFPKVWEFHAWNMSYNISEAVKTPQEKWRWVQEGIRLLRDRGIPANPRSALLYQELARTFFHKIGKYSSFSEAYFKYRHAEEWHLLLGAPPQGSAQALRAWLKPLAEAPETLEAVFSAHPAAAGQVRTLQTWGCELDLPWVRKAGILQAYRADEDLLALQAHGGPEISAADSGLLSWLRNPELAAERQALLAYARAKALRETYHMDPAFMAELVETFGPLDWRHPAAHALYWSLLGARRCEQAQSADLFDLVQTDRLVLHALQELAQTGAASFDPFTKYFNLAPEPLLFDAYEKALVEAGRRQQHEGETPYELKESHRGFLARVTLLTYLRGGRAKAAEYYARLRTLYGDRADYSQPLEAFVRAQAREGLERIENARPAVQSLLYQALVEGLAGERPEIESTYVARARLLYDQYQELQHKIGTAAQEVRVDLPPFLELYAGELARLLTASPAAVHPLLKARVWRGASEELRRWTFDRVREQLYEEARRQKMNPEKAFPEPQGMEEFRKAHRAKPGPAPVEELRP